MNETNCVFSEPVEIGANNYSSTAFSKMTCTSTDLILGTSSAIFNFHSNDTQAYEVDFGGTTTPFYISNIWSAPDILIVSGLALLCVLFIIKIVVSAFLRKKIITQRWDKSL